VSEDEILVTLVGLVVGPVMWAWWLLRLGQISAQQRRPRQLISVAIALIVCTGLIITVLNTAASFDVVDALQYQVMYTVLGMAWLRASASLFPFAGLSVRDDVVERSNPAAAVACAGALFGIACCYAGANIGDGPGWPVVVFCGLLSTGTLIAAWIALVSLSPVSDSVNIDRDAAAGLRLGAFLIACGLILGRATAGDWESVRSAMNDYAQFVPGVIALVALAALVERMARPTAERPQGQIVTWGLLPAIAYLVAAVALLLARALSA
jgi:uncharacterized membrane protein YjfL (UPF0719 family)